MGANDGDASELVERIVDKRIGDKLKATVELGPELLRMIDERIAGMQALIDRALATGRGRARRDFDMVGDFHAKFGLATSDDGPPPGEIPDDVAEFRLRFMIEELQEIARGYGYAMNVDLSRTGDDGPQDLPAVADGLVDLVYVALGTAHFHRLPWGALFAEVQRANMSKERASSAGDARSTRGHSLDVVKPEGFRPPDITGVLMAARWPGPALPDMRVADVGDEADKFSEPIDGIDVVDRGGSER
jgi:predicted HAD superfamily Cof-like phosphohydrolase